MTERRTAHNCVVGLGYVGLTLAIHLDRTGYETVGYDVDERKVAKLQRGHDPTGEFDDATIAESDVAFADTPGAIEHCNYVHVSLPTPVDTSGTPDLSGLEAACETIGRHISDRTIVVFESTLYPGATRTVLRPAVERGAATQGGATFRVGYSPERIVPGGNEFREVTKLVGAEDEATLDALGDLYDSIVDAGVHLAENIELVEASKCLENVQRDVNIALVNEFALACQHLDVDVDPHAVLDAARTKWNFHDYRPGIVGGHCIPIDPHYLRHKFEECGYVPDIIRNARRANERMKEYVCSLTVDALCLANAPRRIADGTSEYVDDLRTEGALPETVAESEILLLGFGYKPNVSDVRNSGVRDIADTFQDMGLDVSGYDPFHDVRSVPESYEFDVLSRLEFDGVDATVLVTAHDELRELDLGTVANRMNEDPVFVDIENAFDAEEAMKRGLTYRTL